MNKNIEKLNNVLQFVKQSFIGKDEIIDLLGICLIAKENAFLLGPPGTAKSAIIRLLSSCIEGYSRTALFLPAVLGFESFLKSNCRTL